MIAKKNITNLFLAFLILHIVLWTLIPAISNLNLPLDTIEALAWGSNLDWGFNKHPPLSALVVEVFFQIFGNQDWVFYLLSQLFVTFSFLIVWKLSHEFFTEKILSLLSVLILTGIYFYNFTTPEFNVNICQLPFWSLTVYYSWKCFKENKVKDWFLLGLFSALGILSKYIFLYLLAAVAIFFIYQNFTSKKINYKPVISLVVFITIIMPHLFWLMQNNFVSIFYAMKRTGIEELNIYSNIINPFIFLLKQSITIIPFILMFLLIVKNIKIKINFKDKKLLFLLFINLLPLALVFITSIILGTKIRTMWMTPFYLFFGIMFIYLFKSKLNLKKIKFFYLATLFIFIFSPFVYLYVSISKTTKRTDYPGKEISYLVQKRWEKNFNNEIKVVVGDEWFAGNLSYHLPSRPKWYNSIENKMNVINKKDGVIYIGNPDVLKKICPGVYGTLKPIGVCMIGSK
jgi:4-amino-4-deoxy-L-arabinose transferase-like glycosyltransferase